MLITTQTKNDFPCSRIEISLESHSDKTRQLAFQRFALLHLKLYLPNFYPPNVGDRHSRLNIDVWTRWTMQGPVVLAHNSQLWTAPWKNLFHGTMPSSWAVEAGLQLGEAKAQREASLGGFWLWAMPVPLSSESLPGPHEGHLQAKDGVFSICCCCGILWFHHCCSEQSGLSLQASIPWILHTGKFIIKSTEKVLPLRFS